MLSKATKSSCMTSSTVTSTKYFQNYSAVSKYFLPDKDCILLAIEKLRQHPLNLGCHAGEVLPDC